MCQDSSHFQALKSQFSSLSSAGKSLDFCLNGGLGTMVTGLDVATAIYITGNTWCYVFLILYS